MSAKEQAVNDTSGRSWQVGDRAWNQGDVWRRYISPFDGRAWWRSDNLVSAQHRTDADMTAAGAVLVATAAGPVQPTDAIRPQVLTEDMPEPPRPWAAMRADGGDTWDDFVCGWGEVVEAADGRPVYVISGQGGAG